MKEKLINSLKSIIDFNGPLDEMDIYTKIMSLDQYSAKALAKTLELEYGNKHKFSKLLIQKINEYVN